MGRSKWLVLLLLLIPALCGFDTRNPFRTRGPFKAADFTIGGGSPTWEGTWGACTAGVDCFCDRAQGNGPLGTSDPVYNTNIFFCEDWDHDAFWATTPTDVNDSYGRNNWVSTSGALFGSNDRGGGSRWAKKYLNTSTGFTWRDGQPTTACGSVITNVGSSGIGSGPKEWDADDRWCANAYGPWIDIIHEDTEFYAENPTSSVPSIPGTGGASKFGDNILATRNQPGGGTAGYLTGGTGSSFGGTRSQLGITAAVGYESNIIASNILTDAWKHDEFSADRDGSSSDGLFGFRQTNSPANTFPIQGLIFAQDFTCTTAIASVVEHRGNIACTGGNVALYYHALSGTGDGFYTWPDDFDLDELHCMQAYWDFRTISSVTFKMWLDGELLIHAEGINLTGSYYDGTTDGVDRFAMNNYSNEGFYRTHGGILEATRRYNDNYIMREGTPVSCNDIGFPLIND